MHQSRHCGYITYRVKTWFLIILSVYYILYVIFCPGSYCIPLLHLQHEKYDLSIIKTKKNDPMTKTEVYRDQCKPWVDTMNQQVFESVIDTQKH